MNDERNTKIVRLWNNGYSTGEIARALAITKNTVTGAIVKHRALGDITRPTIDDYSERGRLGNIAKWGLRRRKQQLEL
jgi:hypothetical protein